MDGDFVPWEAATIHLLSHSAQRGSLVFDYMSVNETPKGAAVFRLPEHVERLEHSCELVGLALPLSRAELSEAVLTTARANPGATAVKISAYLPSIEIDVVPLDSQVSIAIAAYDPAADILARKEMKAPKRPRTLALWIEKERRNRRADIVPAQAKVAANYVSTMTAKARARTAGYDEILLIDEFGQVAEGPTTNLFMVDRDGALRTPPDTRVLLGVTRSSILELARADGNAVREAPIMPEELDEASEVFLTGTTAGVWPVSSIDGRPVGDGEIGPVARALGERFRQAAAGEDPEFEHWLTLVK
jgi:branched-chain amino acid aminotransferase